MNFTASYRIQLRAGMDFAALETRLDHIAGLGVSHLYLSPILTAAPGSTHGYDVTDPTAIDPALGGLEGFEALSRAAQDRGLAVVLDHVPNHMAFGLDTPWLRDVLAHGRDSDAAPIFDIDWGGGPLALPWLTCSLAEAAEEGDAVVEDGRLITGGLALPLAPGTAPPDGPLDVAGAERLHEAQHWRLLPWQLERDSITHRRFFSVTSLIGVRVEDEAVFERTHAALFDLIERDLVHGLRIDHVDGLVDPPGYMARLASRLPDCPVWVEKILVTGESLPRWPVAGTTGYEVAATTARALADSDGVARIDALWRAETGIEGNFHEMVEQAKREMLTDELAAELRQLIVLAAAAAAEDQRLVGPEMLREALTELLTAFPRYRSYIGNAPTAADAQIWRDAADRAAGHARLRAEIDWIVDRILAADTEPARRLAVRLEQVTGALLAKAHEDTAGFRFNRFLAANEVGADPDRPTADADDMQAALDHRLEHWPRAMTLGSSHDTKRSEDSRARILATSHDPDAFAALWSDASARPGSDGLDANRRFYAIQTALALWGEPEAGPRAADHMVKALREGKEVSYWIAPDEEREGAMRHWTTDLLDHWDRTRPEALLRLVRIGEGLSLQDLALRCLFPGMPDIYQGGEGPLLQLTDPDNRRQPDWETLENPPDDSFAARKGSLLRLLLRMRADDPELFAAGRAVWERGAVRRLSRHHENREVAVILGASAPDALWTFADEETGITLSLRAGSSRSSA